MGVSLHELTFLAYAASKEGEGGLGNCITLKIQKFVFSTAPFKAASYSTGKVIVTEISSEWFKSTVLKL